MRRVRVGMALRLLSAVALVLAGCQTQNTTIKPPLHEEYTIPPADDSRFSSPPTYPKETMDSNQFKKQQTKPEQIQTPGRFGAGPGGMGGY
jgi:hypothetical protein